MEPQPFFLKHKQVLYIKLFNKTRKLIVNYFKFFLSFVFKEKKRRKEARGGQDGENIIFW